MTGVTKRHSIIGNQELVLKLALNSFPRALACGIAAFAAFRGSNGD
jgi:hypothetical protein